MIPSEVIGGEPFWGVAEETVIGPDKPGFVDTLEWAGLAGLGPSFRIDGLPELEST